MRLSARWTLAPFAVVAALLFTDPTLTGEYNLTVDVADQSLVGKGAMTPADSGRFTGKFEFPEPFALTLELSGQIVGDSVSYTGKYSGTTGCSGTWTARGTVDAAGNAASGPVSLSDSCYGELPAAWRLSR